MRLNKRERTLSLVIASAIENGSPCHVSEQSVTCPEPLIDLNDSMSVFALICQAGLILQKDSPIQTTLWKTTKLLLLSLRRGALDMTQFPVRLSRLIKQACGHVKSAAT